MAEKAPPKPVSKRIGKQTSKPLEEAFPVLDVLPIQDEHNSIIEYQEIQNSSELAEKKPRGNNQRKFPVCSAWKSSNVAKRLDIETRAGGFGQGVVVDCLENNEKREEDGNDKKGETTEKTDDNPLMKLRKVFNQMTDAVFILKDVMEDIGKDQSKVRQLLQKPFDENYISISQGKREEEISKEDEEKMEEKMEEQIDEKGKKPEDAKPGRETKR